MNDIKKTKEQLINELSELHNQNAELKKSEHRLRASEKRYKRFVDAVTDCIYTAEIVKGRPGRITNISICASIIGYMPEEYLANPHLFDEMVHEDDRYVTDKQVQSLIATGSCKPIEHRVIHKDGSVKWVKKTLVPHYDETGTLVAYDGLVSDITRQKEMESRLIQSETISSLGVLSAGVAHEIKNPLAIILQGIELLEISLLKEGVDDVLALMKDAVFRASRITRDLLTFSRENTPALEEIDLARVINETLSLVDHIFSLKQIKIVRNFSPDLPRVRVDSNQMKQVFINLLTNAAEAMPEGGTITISAYNSQNIHNKKILRIVIVDTGCGISKEDRQRAFDPFYTTKKKSGGTGLGLSVAKGIIEKHKGDIRIESEPGKGTSVIIELQCYGNKMNREVSDGR
jgi:PAS domain S-box-containing protein